MSDRKPTSTGNPVDDFIAEAERILREHCDPDKPEGWLSEKDELPVHLRLVGLADDAAGYLAPRIGKEEADALVAPILNRFTDGFFLCTRRLAWCRQDGTVLGGRLGEHGLVGSGVGYLDLDNAPRVRLDDATLKTHAEIAMDDLVRLRAESDLLLLYKRLREAASAQLGGGSQPGSAREIDVRPGCALAVVEVLKCLARRRLELEEELAKQAGNTPDRAKADEYDTWHAALDDVILFVHERTGIPRDDLWEAAHRVGTNAGVVAWTRETDPAFFNRWQEWRAKAKSDEDRVRRSKVNLQEYGRLTGDTPDLKQYRDLTWILPKLAELDGKAGTTASLSTLLLRKYPAITATLGFTSESVATAPPTIVIEVQNTNTVALLEAAAGGNDKNPPVPEYVFRQNGEIWEVHFGEEHGVFSNRKGFAIIAKLLKRPNPTKPFTAFELMGIDPTQVNRPSERQPILDADARQAYQFRYRELDNEIERTEKNNDTSKTEKLKEERQKLAEEFSKATGIYGRDRLLNVQDAATRAFEAVRKQISRTYEALAEASPSMPCLVAHLRESIRMGSGCFAYNPPASHDWYVS